MPRAKMPEEERCRLLSVYLRPWVLHRKYASPHVPHLVDLDRPVSRVLNHPRIMQRLRKKNKCDPEKLCPSVARLPNDARGVAARCQNN